MNHGQIDPLLQLPLPPRDGGGVSNRVRGDRVTFDRHFQSFQGPGATASPPPPPNGSSDGNESKRRSASEPTPVASQPPQHQTPAQKSAAQSTASHAELADEESVDKQDQPADAEVDAAEITNAAARTAAVPTSPAQPAVTVSPAEEVVVAVDTTAQKAGAGTITAGVPANTEVPPRNTDVPNTRRQANAAQRENIVVEEVATKPQSPGDSSDAANQPQPTNAKHDAEFAEAASLEVAADAVDTPASESELIQQNGRRSDEKSRESDSDPAAGRPSQSRSDRITPPAEALAASAKASTDDADPNDLPIHGAETDAPTDSPQVESDRQSSAKREERANTSSSTRTRSTPVSVSSASPSAASVVTPTQALEESSTDSTEGTSKVESRTADTKPSPLTALARLERGGSLAARGAASSHAHDGPQVDPARFVSRVVRAIHAANDRGGPLLLRLSPPELGALRLEISLQQGALSATIEADNPHARQLLLDNLPALRDRLAEQNVRIDRFDVDVRHDGNGHEPSNFNPQQHRQQRDPAPSRNRAAGNRAVAATEPESTTPVPTRRISDTSINVIA